MQAEVEGRNVSKVIICFSRETPGDIDRPLDGYTIGDFRNNIKEVVIHAGMEDFHRLLVASVAVTAAHVSAILTVNRDKKHRILLAVRSKDRNDRDDRISAQMVSDIFSKKKTKKRILLPINKWIPCRMSVCHGRFYPRIDILLQ